MLEAKLAAGVGESLRAVARAVVGHHAGHGDAEAFVVGDRSIEEGDGAFLAFVRQDLAEGDAMADPLEPAELLDVDVDHLARMGTLVAPDRLGRRDVLQPRQAGALEHPADGGRRDADLMGDVPAGEALPTQRHDAFGDQRGGGLRHADGP